MKIVYLSNILNHYQKSLCDEFFKIPNVEFYFIATTPLSDERRLLGIPCFNETEKYCICAYKNKEEERNAYKLFIQADVCMFGACPKKYKYFVKRRKSKNKIIFYTQERNYKQEPTKIALFLRRIVYLFRHNPYKKSYVLCASAFTSFDYSRTKTFLNKCFKWGYFSKFIKIDDIKSFVEKKNGEKAKILWVGRFLEWKHPESMICLAEFLKSKNYNFEIRMIGVGEQFEYIKNLIIKKNLSEYVTLLGSLPPDEVRKYMNDSNIFAFTSDRGEGWGVVLNEAMNSACAVVCGSNIGSVPYLIKNRINGLIYKNNDWLDLCANVEKLIIDKNLSYILAQKAYLTIERLWNPEVAAKRAVSLFGNLVDGKSTPYNDGPCSLSEIIQDDWYE